MLKHLSLLLIGLMSCFMASAQTTCQISQEGDTVEVLSVNLDNNNSSAVVSLSNDSNLTSANVTVTIKVTYTYGNTKEKTYSGKTIVRPGLPVELVIPIALTHPDNASYKANSVEVVSISGNKCM